jgi:hypothetical protein
MSFGKFLTKYSGELATVAKVASTIVSMLPLGRQDRKRVTDLVEKLETASANVAAAAEKAIGETGEISRDALKDVVREIVHEILPDIVGGVAEKKARENVDKPKRVRKRATKPAGK